MSAQQFADQIDSLSQDQIYEFNQIAEATNAGVFLVLVGESTATTWGGTVADLVAELSDQSNETITEIYNILKGGTRPGRPIRKA